MKLRHLIYPIALFVFPIATSAQRPSPKCAVTTLPPDISEIVKSEFVGWRIKDTEDLDPYLRQLWKKSKQDTCPGIASGHFLVQGKRTFAVLLVPGIPDTKGYKVIVFIESDDKPKAVSILDVKDQDGGDIVIYRLPPGVYSSPENDNRIRSRLDGLQVERMEVSTTVYFWRNNRFESLTTSD